MYRYMQVWKPKKKPPRGIFDPLATPKNTTLYRSGVGKRNYV